MALSNGLLFSVLYNIPTFKE